LWCRNDESEHVISKAGGNYKLAIQLERLNEFPATQSLTDIMLDVLDNACNVILCDSQQFLENFGHCLLVVEDVTDYLSNL
jgi:hypothetical protein